MSAGKLASAGALDSAGLSGTVSLDCETSTNSQVFGTRVAADDSQ